MLHTKRPAQWFLAALVFVALVLPLPALAASAEKTASTQTQPRSAQDYAAQLRTRVSAPELESRLARERAWLRDYWRTQPQRPPVDPDAQRRTVAEWTVLVYIAADNNLEAAGLMDLNELEGVGSSPNVNIVAQIDRSADYTDWDGDWTETRRYYIQQDSDPDYIHSPVVQNLGEVNTGSPEAVADFAIWGITNYPARKYMLVLWDHGGAWISHLSDEDTGDDLSLSELTGALDSVKAATGLDKFEVLGFDMCLMSQLEVYQAIAPYARYSVGSEENEPGAGWFYMFLEKLVQNPSMEGAELSRYVVEYFMYFLREVVGDDDIYGLAAVDLSQLGGMTAALSAFNQAVSANPAAALSPIADARNNTISYGGFDDPEMRDFWSSIDLYRFAQLLFDITPSAELRNAASGVMQAVNQFVLYEDHVAALSGSNGVSIYFPLNPKVFDYFREDYAREVPPTMSAWYAFLGTFHGVVVETVTNAPQVSIVGVYPDVVSIYQPAVIKLDISGRDILQVNYAVAYHVDGNADESVVLDFDYLVSRITTPSGESIVDWSDGVTTRTFSWEAEVPMLSDGTTQTYALLIPNRDNPGVALVNGFYRSARGGEDVKAQLLFDLEARRSISLWGLNETAGGNVQPFEINVEQGDTFTPLWLTLDAEQNLSGQRTGDTLRLTDATSITFEKVPAPSGTYSISFVAENVAGEKTLAESVVQVNNDGLDPSLRGFTDVTFGVNFLYPADWIRPRFTPDGERLFTAHMASNTVLSLYPYTDVNSAQETEAAVRASWNALDNLQIVQSREVEINGLPAYVTDYTYDYRGQKRMGAVIAIYVPSQGVGYAFDLDAPLDNTAPAQAALQALIGSINFFDPQNELGQSAWQTVTLAEGLVSFPVPSGWPKEEASGWVLYGPPTDKAIFVGLNAVPASGNSYQSIAEYWLGQLQSNRQNVQVLASEPYYIGGREWHVVVFTYEGVQKIGGAFFTTTVGGKDITFWIEAPDAQFDALYQDVFSVVIGGFAFNG